MSWSWLSFNVLETRFSLLFFCQINMYVGVIATADGHDTLKRPKEQSSFVHVGCAISADVCHFGVDIDLSVIEDYVPSRTAHIPPTKISENSKHPCNSVLLDASVDVCLVNAFLTTPAMGEEKIFPLGAFAIVNR